MMALKRTRSLPYELRQAVSAMRTAERYLRGAAMTARDAGDAAQFQRYLDFARTRAVIAANAIADYQGRKREVR